MPADVVTTISKWKNQRFWCSNYIPDLSGSNCFHCLLFSKVCRNFTLQLRHWMKSYNPRNKWTWLNRMLIVLFGKSLEISFIFSPHLTTISVVSNRSTLRTLSQWLPGKPEVAGDTNQHGKGETGETGNGGVHHSSPPNPKQKMVNLEINNSPCRPAALRSRWCRRVRWHQTGGEERCGNNQFGVNEVAVFSEVFFSKYVGGRWENRMHD